MAQAVDQRPITSGFSLDFGWEVARDDAHNGGQNGGYADANQDSGDQKNGVVGGENTGKRAHDYHEHSAGEKTFEPDAQAQTAEHGDEH